MAFGRLLLLLICLPFCTLPAAAQKKFKLQNGDLLFQDLDCGELCNAIESVTSGYNNSTFSHVGIVKIDANGKVKVLEAIGANVHYTPLDQFLKRQLDKDQKPKVAVGRFRKEYQNLIPAAIISGEKFLGKPYDDVFAIDNDAYYCSELVYFMFKEANSNKEIFPLAPMTYASLGSETIMPVWESYFGNLKVKVPQNDPGLNPGGISCSDKLKIYFPFGSPGKNNIRKN